MSVNDSLPHGGRTWCPWPHDPPEGWPYEYVARVDYDALAARLADSQDECRSFKARLAERELDWMNQCEQIKDLQAQLAKACAYLREVGDDYPGSSCQRWCREKAAECEGAAAEALLNEGESQ